MQQATCMTTSTFLIMIDDNTVVSIIRVDYANEIFKWIHVSFCDLSFHCCQIINHSSLTDHLITENVRKISATQLVIHSFERRCFFYTSLFQVYNCNFDCVATSEKKKKKNEEIVRRT